MSIVKKFIGILLHIPILIVLLLGFTWYLIGSALQMVGIFIRQGAMTMMESCIPVSDRIGRLVRRGM